MAAPQPGLVRANTDIGPRLQLTGPSKEEDDLWELRHGWQDQYDSENLDALGSEFFMYYIDSRHEYGGKLAVNVDLAIREEWRVKDRVKTQFACLMICLNIGVDPPDVVKTSPAAALECWIDPASPVSTSSKVMETIGKALQSQYETISLRTRYKQYLDPSFDETRKCCINLRRSAREERVLFHYNGHGVPLPTASGEIWYFNRGYTQYIPVSLYDLQSWLAGPSIYVLDVSHAGNVVQNFGRFVEKHEAESKDALEKDPDAQVQNYCDNILLAACGKRENLPTDPNLPADLFTCCLTTPIHISLRCFVLNAKPPMNLTFKDLENVPGRLQERRTPLGELNWIFTAITDTIAWNSLPRDVFRKLFRQDLMVAALFRNYLLADRIMRDSGCRPETLPALPTTHDHPLWQSWDLAVESVLMQLPAMIACEENGIHYEFRHSPFFTEQLTAFEMYLQQGSFEERAPDQLPIVLQVLLSQNHRLRALILLSRFLDLGPWAVNLALSIGIFPYVLKLLQSAAYELKPVLIFIWSRILAVDPTCQADLLRDNGYKYFLQVLRPEAGLPVGNHSEHKAMSAFIVAMFCRDFHQGQVVCLSPEIFNACIGHFSDTENSLLRQWSCLCISMLWKDFPEAKWAGIDASAHQRICEMVLDPMPEVRAAVIHALTNFLGIPDVTEQVAQIERSIAATLMIMTSDGSNMVRNELIIFFSAFAHRYENKFVVVALEELVEEKKRLEALIASADNTRSAAAQAIDRYLVNGQAGHRIPLARLSVYSTMWKHLLVMSVDPHAEVAQSAMIVIDCIHKKLLGSSLGPQARIHMAELIKLGRRPEVTREPSLKPLPRLIEVSANTVPAAPVPKAHDGYLSLGLRRTASALRSFTLREPVTKEAPIPNGASPRRSSEAPRSAPLRTRVPDDWSRPPDANDHIARNAQYQRGRVPMPRAFNSQRCKNGKVPLKSELYEWSTMYFRHPQMKSSEMEEPGSLEYNSRKWRIARNEKTLAATQPLKGVAGTSRWDVALGSLANEGRPLKLCFHQFEDHLAAADDRDGICVWNWKEKTRLHRFSNGNPEGSKINDVCFINEEDQALLISGSSDGVVKIFRNYDSASIELVSAFRGLTDLISSTKNVGMVLNWQQGQGKLLVAGDVKVIRIWNAATEICTGEIPARSNSCITSLTSDQVAGHIFVAGFGDGKVRVFDQRERPVSAMKQAWSGHKQWITNVHFQRGGMRELVSGSRSGEIKLWDIRMTGEIRTIQATQQTLRTLSVHEHAPIFAAGSHTHQVNMFNMNGTLLNSIEPPPSFLPARTNPIAATAFHPHHMTLAYSSLHDQHINLVSCPHKERAVWPEV